MTTRPNSHARNSEPGERCALFVATLTLSNLPKWRTSNGGSDMSPPTLKKDARASEDSVYFVMPRWVPKNLASRETRYIRCRSRRSPTLNIYNMHACPRRTRQPFSRPRHGEKGPPTRRGCLLCGLFQLIPDSRRFRPHTICSECEFHLRPQATYSYNQRATPTAASAAQRHLA